MWVPDELAEQARAAQLNVSAVTQAAIREEIARHVTDAWLATLPEPRGVSRAAAARALDEARDEFGQH